MNPATTYLSNFFKYYDPNNSNHVNAIALLEQRIESGKISNLFVDDADWVKLYRTPIVNTKSKILHRVVFYPQTDNYRDAPRTCNSSSCAMWLEFYKPGTLIGPKGDDAYIKKVFAIGDSTDHDVQTKVLASYGVKSLFSKTCGFDDLNKELVKGPVVISILHRGSLSAPTGGHVIVCIGRTEIGDYIFNDPYGSLNDGYTSDVKNGKEVIYKKSVLEKRWTVANPKDGWMRLYLGSV
jgi:hypothetical protein